MRVDKGLLARRAAWCAAWCVVATLLATGHALADPLPVPPPDTTGRLWSWGVLGSVFFDLVFDLVVLAIVGWLIGAFGRGFGARFLLWGAAIWLGGLAADAIAWHPAGTRVNMVVTAIFLIFIWNLLLAAVISKMVWWRTVVLASAIAVVTAPYFMPEGTRSERAALMSCISNLKQIVAAAKLYADDWQGVLPDVGSYDGDFCGNWTPGADWRDAIRDYVKAGAEVFSCPWVGIQTASSYAWNRHLSRCPEKAVQYPNTCPLAWDFVPGVGTAPGIPLDPPDDVGERGSETRWAYYPAIAGVAKADMARACSRHTGGLVLAFVDGHAKWFRPTSERFAPAADVATPWPSEKDRGIVISMYPRDPLRAQD